MFDKQAHVLLKDSKYENRLTIGKKDIIEKASMRLLKISIMTGIVLI